MPRAARKMGVSLVAVLLGGCLMSDPSPDPSQAAIDILANGPGVCEPSEGLSWVAGQHDIFVVAIPGLHVRVIVVDPAGRTVFEKHRNWFHGRNVKLAPGRYLLRCLYADGTSGETALVVTRVRSSA